MSEVDTSSGLLDERAAAAFLGLVSIRTLQDWRRRGTGGPAYTKLGRRVGYSIEDLQAFKAAGRVEAKPAETSP